MITDNSSSNIIVQTEQSAKGSRGGRIRRPISLKLLLLVLIAGVPFMCIAIFMMYALNRYSDAYNRVVRNMTQANSYNLTFKDEMDEDLYKLVARGEPFSVSEGAEEIEDPYERIDTLRDDFRELEVITTDATSRRWLQTLLRNIDTLEDRVDDIRDNLEEGGHYDENIVMLNNNIYILTELIQDDIQNYIYYQAQSMEVLREAMHRQELSFISYMILLIAVVIGVVLYVALHISRSITEPIRDLNRVTHEIAQGDFSFRAKENNDDELGTLSASVNDMADHLSVMMQQIRDDERKMRKAELRLLQEQINPHFLYNTLDTLVWLIEDGKTEEAENMVVSLSTFFRTVLSGGREYITIQDEERHIRSYLEIQQMRYKDILHYEIRIDPAVYPFKILKMTLQPLVENALYHGIKNKRGGGTILVTGYRDGGLIRLDVRDDGAGMETAELETLRQNITKPCKETDKGFGMANVNERIRMNFGMNYGLAIDSEPGKGTTVEVTIPAVRDVKEEQERAQ